MLSTTTRRAPISAIISATSPWSRMMSCCSTSGEVKSTLSFPSSSSAGKSQPKLVASR